MTPHRREQLNARPADRLDYDCDERDHFYLCGDCGQAIDVRRLGDVLHHEEDEHERLSVH